VIPLQELGKLFLIVGLLFLLVGGAILLAAKIPFLGRLPGDIVIQRRNFTFYFPLTTSILLSILLTLLFYLFGKK